MKMVMNDVTGRKWPRPRRWLAIGHGHDPQRGASRNAASAIARCLIMSAPDLRQYQRNTIAEFHATVAQGKRRIIIVGSGSLLLVPREMKVKHSGGVKAMTDEQLEAGIEAIQAMLEQRAVEGATLIEPAALPAPEEQFIEAASKSE
jgi:hypothetical protein